ncbi:unnamed protein product, partial [Ectocarpus fasciculatus]
MKIQTATSIHGYFVHNSAIIKLSGSTTDVYSLLFSAANITAIHLFRMAKPPNSENTHKYIAVGPPYRFYDRIQAHAPRSTREKPRWPSVSTCLNHEVWHTHSSLSLSRQRMAKLQLENTLHRLEGLNNG